MHTNDVVLLTNQNTLKETMDEIHKHFPKDINEIWLSYFSFLTTYHFLPEIWSRIVVDIKLIAKNSDIEATYYSPYAEEGAVPSPEEIKIMDEYKKHEDDIILDIEDWFLHSHILLDKFAKLNTKLFGLLACNPEEKKIADHIPYSGFNYFRDFFLKTEENIDKKYKLIIQQYTDWYIYEIKNIRDDLIQHEMMPKMWGSSMDSSTESVYFSYTRFRNSEKTVKMMYDLRDKNAENYPQIKTIINFHQLLDFFEKKIEELDEDDKEEIKRIRKRRGNKIPDIIELYEKMATFFIYINAFFIEKIKESFGVHSNH